MKQTPITKRILETLTREAKPLSAPQILELICRGSERQPNKTTVYRQLDSLLIAEMVSQVFLQPGVIHYEIQSKHHHHFFCHSCEDVECIYDASIEQAVEKCESKLSGGFCVQDHQFSLSGLCPKCTHTS